MKQIKLNQPHVHAGISYAAGDVIEVTDADAAYLIRHQIGVNGKSAVKNRMNPISRLSKWSRNSPSNPNSQAITPKIRRPPTAKPKIKIKENNNGTR